MGENTFVRNAWLDGNWGQEERCPAFHFMPGSPFVLKIVRGVGADYFSVWVDGQLAGEFKFRGKVNAINTVYIQGDVVLNRILLNVYSSETRDCHNFDCKIYCND